MKLEVLVSLKDDIRVVTARRVLPGLAAHQSPNPKKSDVWVTHMSSGLAVATGLDDRSLGPALLVLRRAEWRLPAVDIYESEVHRALAREVAEMVATKSYKQETRIANELGGRVSPASGAGIGLKRDVRTKKVLVEAKTTDKDTYLLRVDDLDLLTKQAFQEGKCPAYVVEIRQHEEVVLLPEYEVFELTGEDPPAVVRTEEVTGMSISINEELVLQVLRGGPVRYKVHGEPYILVSYETFVFMAKP